MTRYSGDPDSASIHVSTPALIGNERKYVLDCIDRGWLSMGRYVARVEHEFRKITGRRFAIATSSGTTALHLAMLGLDVGPGDVVIVPALTYIASANCAAYCGADIEFVDVDPDTWCISIEDVRVVVEDLEAMGRTPTACVAVHLYDSMADLPALARVLPEGCAIIEDSAQAIGARHGLIPAGAGGVASVFSMYGNKTIAAGEGGVLLTDDEELAARARLLRGQGASVPGVYQHAIVGYNYRLSELPAAVALAQLERLDDHLARRRAVIQRYNDELVGLVELQAWCPGQTSNGAWIFAATLPRGNAESLRHRLVDQYGIETRPFFVPLHKTDAYMAPSGDVALPQSVDLFERGLLLPTHAGMTRSDVDRVVAALKEVL